MTPTEKAMDLLNKFYHLKDEDGFYLFTKYRAKQCACIAVDEVMYSNLMEQPQHTMIYNTHKNDYWHKVKEKINELCK
jgi:hypothetical protein